MTVKTSPVARLDGAFLGALLLGFAGFLAGAGRLGLYLDPLPAAALGIAMGMLLTGAWTVFGRLRQPTGAGFPRLAAANAAGLLFGAAIAAAVWASHRVL